MTSETKSLKSKREDLTGTESGTPFSKIFTKLYQSEGDNVNINKQHEVWQLERASRIETRPDKPIECSDIFKGTGKPIRLVLTKGIAGIGKTFSVYKFALDWARRKANQDIKLLIRISFRELNLVAHEQYSLLKLIHVFHPALKELTAEQLVACNPVFILDGLDESKLPLHFRKNGNVDDVELTTSVDVLMTNLISGTLMPSAQLWITTRPAAASKIPPEYVDRVTEVRGFTDPQKNKYFEKTSDEELAKRIISHLKTSRSLHIMCHIPLFCSITSTVLKKMLETDTTGQLPKTLVQMYSHFLSVQMKRKMKYDETYDVKQLEVFLLKLGRLAFEQLEKDNLIFYRKDLLDCDLDVTDTTLFSGVCTEIFKSESGLFKEVVYSFVHLSIQEFLAAVYLLRCYNDGEMKIVETFLEDSDWKNNDKEEGDLQNDGKKEEEKKDDDDDDDDKEEDYDNDNDDYHDDDYDDYHDDEEDEDDNTLRRFCHMLEDSDLKNGNKEEDDDPQNDEKEDEKKDDEDDDNKEDEDNTRHMSHDVFLDKAMLKSLKSKNGHLDLFLRFLHGLSLQSNQNLLGGLLGQTKSSPESIQKTIKNLKEMNISGAYNPDRCINIFHCLMEMNDDSVYQEILQYLESGDRSQTELSDTQCSALAHMLQMSDKVLEELDLDKYNTSERGRQRLIPAVRNCSKARLVDCNINEAHCEVLFSAISSKPSHLLELDLSNNILPSRGVVLLSEGLKSPQCELKSLRLSSCHLSERDCKLLVSALCSNPAHLTELDFSINQLMDSGVKLLTDARKLNLKLVALRLSYCLLSKSCCENLASVLSSPNSCLELLDLSFNELQDFGVKRLSAGLESQHCKLKTLSLSHCLVSEEGCASLASAISSNPSLDLELDLSFNYPGNSAGLKTFKLDHGEEHWVQPQLLKSYLCPLTLDTNTTNRSLSVSENNRKVTRERKKRLYFHHADRFVHHPQVLCREGLPGHCYWEVEPGRSYWEVEWSGRVAVALSDRGTNRGGVGADCLFGHNDTSWSLECHGGTTNRYTVLHNKKRTVLAVCPSDSNRVGVHLDCPAGTLSFYRVSSDSLTHLYTFQSTFSQPLYAGFSIESGFIELSDEVDHSKVDITSFTPSVNTEQYANEYRFKFPRVGLFECSLTGLAFGTTGKGEIVYRTVLWEERWFQSTGRTPAGPLFDIQCPQKCVRQLRLPHCAITPGNALSVAHITDEGGYLVEPLNVTQTHVVINVTHLSPFGLLRKLLFGEPEVPEPDHMGQVLLLLRPPRSQIRELSVILLPSNVPVEEVMAKPANAKKEFIEVNSNCVLIPKQDYILQCLPTSYEVYPKAVTYRDYGRNYHRSFNVDLGLKAEVVKLTLLTPELKPEDKPVWEDRFRLDEHHPDTRPSQPAVSTVKTPLQEEKILQSVRSEFVNRVSEAVIKGLLDILYDENVLNYDEMDEVRDLTGRVEKARRLIDMLRKKGNKAFLKMTTGLHQLDPTLHEELGLDKP